MRPRIGISLGDVTGVGPEVTLKALARLLAAPAPGDAPRYLLLGDAGWLERVNRNTQLPLEPDDGPATAGRLRLRDPRSAPLPARLTAGAAPAALAAVDWLRAGAELCLRGELDALVTAPVSKQAIREAGVPFVGQTEFLSELARTPRTVMMLLGHDAGGRWLRVALATTHLPLRAVPDAVNRENVLLAIERAAEACRLLELPRARVAVCGLNPHAGERGGLGHEEIDVVAPAVAAAQAGGCDAHGPFAADTLFHLAWRGDYDAVVALYHDQGLGPLKLLAFDSGVNWTLGLPFVRTSPDHGTAYDLAGQNQARPDSMEAALRLAERLARRRTREGPAGGAQFTDGSSGESASKV
jgi:4-hydroxythreonine-4-phosphate dehydrogenase